MIRLFKKEKKNTHCRHFITTNDLTWIYQHKCTDGRNVSIILCLLRRHWPYQFAGLRNIRTSCAIHTQSQLLTLKTQWWKTEHNCVALNKIEPYSWIVKTDHTKWLEDFYYQHANKMKIERKKNRGIMLLCLLRDLHKQAHNIYIFNIYGNLYKSNNRKTKRK